MNKPAFFLLSLVVLGSTLLPAQVPSEPALVKSPPPGSMWVIKIENTDAPKDKNKADASSAAPVKDRVPSQLTIKLGLNSVFMGQISYTDSSQDIFYVASGCVLLPVSNLGTAYSQDLRANQRDVFALRVAPFPATNWINKGNDKGAEKKSGIDCEHYAKVEKAQSGDIQLEAWIRLDDLYPVEARVGATTYHFEPATPFAEEITLPDAYRAALGRLKAERSALDALRRANEAQ